MKVPRPSGGGRHSPGVGKIYVKFENSEGATAALKSLAGRKFADRTVVTTYYSEVSSVQRLEATAKLMRQENFDVNAW